MSLKLIYYGQNDGSTVPECTLTGDPGTDQAALTAAGFLGGRIVALGTATLAQNTAVSITLCDSATQVPFATLLNGPGEFAGAIGPSGSRKAPVVRALWQGIVDSDAFAGAYTSFTIGGYLYCGAGANKGKYIGAAAGTGSFETVPVGICTHVPTTSEPWLGVASLL